MGCMRNIWNTYMSLIGGGEAWARWALGKYHCIRGWSRRPSAEELSQRAIRKEGTHLEQESDDISAFAASLSCMGCCAAWSERSMARRPLSGLWKEGGRCPLTGAPPDSLSKGCHSTCFLLHINPFSFNISPAKGVSKWSERVLVPLVRLKEQVLPDAAISSFSHIEKLLIMQWYWNNATISFIFAEKAAAFSESNLWITSIKR